MNRFFHVSLSSILFLNSILSLATSNLARNIAPLVATRATAVPRNNLEIEDCMHKRWQMTKRVRDNVTRLQAKKAYHQQKINSELMPKQERWHRFQEKCENIYFNGVCPAVCTVNGAATIYFLCTADDLAQAVVYGFVFAGITSPIVVAGLSIAGAGLAAKIPISYYQSRIDFESEECKKLKVMIDDQNKSTDLQYSEKTFYAESKKAHNLDVPSIITDNSSK